MVQGGKGVESSDSTAGGHKREPADLDQTKPKTADAARREGEMYRVLYIAT